MELPCGTVKSSDTALDLSALTKEELSAALAQLRYLPAVEEIRLGALKLAELEELQKKILRNAVSYLREGGTLIYSTCTIHRGENEEMAAFIERELGLKPDPLAPHLPEGVPGIKGLPGTGGETETAGETTANCLQLLPHVHGTDGFFLARFIK